MIDAMTTSEKFLVQAVKELKPDATSFEFLGTEILNWKDNVDPPTKEEIDAKIKKLKE